MNNTVQLAVVVLLVAAAAGYLAARFLKNLKGKRASCCSSGGTGKGGAPKARSAPGCAGCPSAGRGSCGCS